MYRPVLEGVNADIRIQHIYTGASERLTLLFFGLLTLLNEVIAESWAINQLSQAELTGLMIRARPMAVISTCFTSSGKALCQVVKQKAYFW